MATQTPAKLDLRIEKTYRALCEAFTALLEERHYEEITVSDLCDRALIRRTTFYKHFADKQEFLAFYVRRIREEFQRRAEPKGGCEDMRERSSRMIHELMLFLRENDRLVQSCLSSNAIETIATVVTHEVATLLNAQLSEEVERGARLCAPASVLAAYVAGGLLTTLLLRRGGRDGVGVDELERDLDAIAGRLLADVRGDR